MLTYTAHGPHKADFRIRADGAPVEDTLSRGQLKLLMCALRLAQGEFLTGEELPLRQAQRAHQELELPARQGVFYRRTVSTNAEIRLVRAVRGVGQHVMDMSDENSKMFTVEKGKITD